MMDIPFLPAEVLIPAGTFDLKRWSVVACDQYTSEPDYWRRVEDFVDGAPSTLRLVLPELYLGRTDTAARIAGIWKNMQDYLDGGVFTALPRGYLRIERTLADGSLREGLIGKVDLEQYDFSPDSESPVRATEGTVLERIPPRVEVRRDAPVELPHIMLLIDDPEHTVIEPLRRTEQQLLYDTELMENGGHLRGYLVSEAAAASVTEALRRLEKRPAVGGRAPLVYAVGDGNHSLATAKTCWEELKRELTPEEQHSHPARYALCELVNLHSEALRFEAIHRVLFDTDAAALEAFLRDHTHPASPEDAQRFVFVTSAGRREHAVTRPSSNLTVGSVEKLIGKFLGEAGGRVDYVHGEAVADRLGRGEHAAAFLLPAMEKRELFPTVMLDGALPRKTFSMGHAWDKRYYFEARRIRP